MRLRSFAIGIAAYASLAIGSFAHAAVVVYELPFIGNWSGYTTTDTSLTFGGTGYVGMYEAGKNGEDAFASLFGIEESDYSRTHAQVGIGGLAGATISSAVLSFDVLDSSDGPQTQSVQITGSSGSGALGYQWDAPGVNYGSTVFDVTNGSNALDITSLLAASVGAGDEWFNLHLQGLLDEVYFWTYAGDGYSIDRANVRLTVTYGPGGQEPSEVPAPAPLGLLLLGLAGVGILRGRSR